jgi:5-methylcytosine-specific restriction endonuclease McrA
MTYTKGPLDHLYKTGQWQSTRQRIVERDLYTCQRCGLMSAAKRALAVDHKIKHNGDIAMFWCDDDGLQTLCAQCHSGHKQSQEKGGAGRVRIGSDGWPIEEHTSQLLLS